MSYVEGNIMGIPGCDKNIIYETLFHVCPADGPTHCLSKKEIIIVLIQTVREAEFAQERGLQV